jgi:hypothetical protein
VGPGAEDGSLENPYHSFVAANAAASGGDHSKDVCVIEGEYPLTATLTPSTNFYGGFYWDGPGHVSRRDVSQESGRSTVLLVTTPIVAVKYDLTRSAPIAFDGFSVKDQGNFTSTEPLLSIENSNPVIRNDVFERSAANGGGFGGTIDRIAVRMKANHGVLNALFADSIVRVPENSSLAGTNIGIEVVDDTPSGGGSVSAYIGRSQITVGKAGRATLGVLGYGNRNDSSLSVILDSNNIQFSSAPQAARRGSSSSGNSDGVGVSVADGGYQGPLAGGESAGIALGVSLNSDLGRAILVSKSFGRTGIRDNKIFGNSLESSGYRSRGIYLVNARAATPSNLFDNFVQSGKGSMYSWGVDIEASTVRLHSNTISASRVDTPWEGEPCDRGFLGLGACGQYDPMGFAAAIHVTNGAPNLEITNNILMAPPVAGRFKNAGVFLTSRQDSLARMDFNLFDKESFCASCLFHGFSESWLNLNGISRNLTNANGNRYDPANLVDPAGQDFHLRSDSVAKDNGVCMPEGVGDIDGDSRPNGGACDIGADEYDLLHLRR